MVERKTPGEIILLVFIYAAVTLVGFVCLYPMLYCLAASFSDPMKLLTHSGALFFPTGFSLRGYQVVMNNPNILIGYRNTLLYVAGSLIVGMTLTPLGAYALSCKGYPWAGYVPCHMRANAPAGAPPAKGAGRITPDSWPGISQSLSSS